MVFLVKLDKEKDISVDRNICGWKLQLEGSKN